MGDGVARGAGVGSGVGPGQVQVQVQVQGQLQGQLQKQKPLLSLYQARNAIPAVAGARYFLCVAKESNQRKATAGLANRGAGQEPKRTVCGITIRHAAPRCPWFSQRQARPNTRPASSPTFTRRMRMRAHGCLFCLEFCDEQRTWTTRV